jgi:plasmid stabilization system protein ParE
MLMLPAAAAGSDLSLAEYRQQLRELSAKVDSLADHPEQAGKTEADIPGEVTVNAGHGQITVSYRDLKDDLAAFSRADAAKRPVSLAQIQNYLRELRDQAEAYEQGTSPTAARQRLADILARREFHSAQGPSPGDLLLGKILSWLARLLDKLPSGRSRFDPVQILVYLFIGVALIVLVLWTVRHLRRPREEQAMREIIPFSPSARGWRVWLAEARTLAQQQDWRNAIHLAYWAGISFLEEQGAWRPDRARTPREYLHLVGLRSARYPALATLTRKFELVWYGHRNAAESDFQETLGQLEKLGCR